jgi:hypothetical protein
VNFCASLQAANGKERRAMDRTGAPLCADVGESRKLPHTTPSDEISPLADSVIHRNVNLPCSIPQSCLYSHMHWISSRDKSDHLH